MHASGEGQSNFAGRGSARSRRPARPARDRSGDACGIKLGCQQAVPRASALHAVVGMSAGKEEPLPPALIQQLLALTPGQQRAAVSLLNTLVTVKGGPVILPATAEAVLDDDEDDDDDCVIATVDDSASAGDAPAKRARGDGARASPMGALSSRPLGPPYKRPRGQAPKGANGVRKEWDEMNGVWIEAPQEEVLQAEVEPSG